MVCKLPLAIFICGMLGTAHAIQMVREERPMLREERPQTRPAKKTFFSDRHTPHSALTAHPLAASLAHVVEQSSNSSTPGTAAKVGSMAQALVALAAKGPMADAFAPVIASIRTSLRTDINNTVSGVGTQLQAKMDAISACATNHGYNSAGIATRIAYDSAKSAYDTAKAAVQTATTAAETECGTKDTKCTTRDNRGNALHNTITTGGDCGAAAPNMFDLENFPLKDASTWADQIKTAVTAWETAATTCATAETTCATKQTDISNALTEKGTKCTALATAATNGKQAYDTCYDTAKGQLTGYDYQAQVTTQKDAIEQIEKLICIVKVAVKSHEEGGTASTDGAIACGDVPVSSGGTTTQAQYRCTCTSSSLTPSEQYQETYDIGVTVPSEPEKDTAWDDKGCADATQPSDPGPCPSSTVGDGWVRVRHVISGNNWHPATDRLAGTDVYGTEGVDTADWSVIFANKVSNYDQFLFATGDCDHWLITNVNDAIGGFYENELRNIQSSSKQATPYKAKWYNRDGKSEDPWISVTDHGPAIAAGEIVYGEASFGLTHASAVLPLHDGADVYIRKAPSPP